MGLHIEFSFEVKTLKKNSSSVTIEGEFKIKLGLLVDYIVKVEMDVIK